MNHPTSVPTPPPPSPPDAPTGPHTPRHVYVTEPFIAFEELPEMIHFTPPLYPRLAKETGIEGTVLVEVVVGIEGKVIDARVRRSDVTPAMEEAALEAAFKCRFRPARQRNVPVPARVVIPFGFHLN